MDQMQLRTDEKHQATLLEIFRLLKDRLEAFTAEAQGVVNRNDRIQRTIQRTTRALKTESWPLRKYSDTGCKMPCGKNDKLLTTCQEILQVFEGHNLATTRKDVEMKLRLQEMKVKLENIEKKVFGKTSQEDVIDSLVDMRKTLNACVEKQTYTAGLVERLCIGVDGLNKSYNSSDGDGAAKKMDNTEEVPAELQTMCKQIKYSQDVDYKDFGRALGLAEASLLKIENTHSEEETENDTDQDEKFHVVLKEWIRLPNTPNVRDLILACSSLNVIKDRALPKVHIKTLIMHMDYLCEEMMDVPIVLPCLISKEIVTPRIAEYIISPATRPDRIRRLVDILCTKEEGFAEFCHALYQTKQDHIVATLRNKRGHKTMINSCDTRQRPRGRRYRSLPELLYEIDENHESEQPDSCHAEDAKSVLIQIVKVLDKHGINAHRLNTI